MPLFHPSTDAGSATLRIIARTVWATFTAIALPLGLLGVAAGAALSSEVTYNANDVTVAFARIPFTTFAGTPNQIAIANAAQNNPA